MGGKLRMRLTDAAVARLRPRERECTIWDTRVVGLGVRVRPSGGARFVFLRKAQGRTKRLSLGPVGANDLDDMRRRCHALMAKPLSEAMAEPAHGAPLFRDFVSGPWEEAHFPHYSPSTRKGFQCSLVNQLLHARRQSPHRAPARTSHRTRQGRRQRPLRQARAGGSAPSVVEPDLHLRRRSAIDLWASRNTTIPRPRSCSPR